MLCDKLSDRKVIHNSGKKGVIGDVNSICAREEILLLKVC